MKKVTIAFMHAWVSVIVFVSPSYIKGYTQVFNISVIILEKV